MTYKITIYEPVETSKDLRFTLGTDGKRPLLVIGLNPSTANDKLPDHTIKRVMSFANKNGYDSFIMLNLYAQRTPNPDELHSSLDQELHTKNVAHILTIIEKYSDISILASWGETIAVRKYLKECLLDIYNQSKNKNIRWLKIGTTTLSGHPRHPSRAADIELTDFDIENYLRRFDN